MSRRENAVDLAKFVDKGVRVKLSGGREGKRERERERREMKEESGLHRRAPDKQRPEKKTPVRRLSTLFLNTVRSPLPLSSSSSHKKTQKTKRNSRGRPQGLRPAAQPRPRRSDRVPPQRRGHPDGDGRDAAPRARRLPRDRRHGGRADGGSRSHGVEPVPERNISRRDRSRRRGRGSSGGGGGDGMSPKRNVFFPPFFRKNAKKRGKIAAKKKGKHFPPRPPSLFFIYSLFPYFSSS